jgi:hypothetical protein
MWNYSESSLEYRPALRLVSVDRIQDLLMSASETEITQSSSDRPEVGLYLSGQSHFNITNYTTSSQAELLKLGKAMDNATLWRSERDLLNLITQREGEL